MRLKFLTAIAALAALASCQSPTGSSSSGYPTGFATVSLSAASSSTYTIQTALSASTTQNTQVALTLPLGSTAQDVYFIFANESASAASATMATVSGDSADSSKETSAATGPASLGISSGNQKLPGTDSRILAANTAVAKGWKSASAARSGVAVTADSSSSTGSTVGSTASNYIIPSSETSSYTVGTNCSYDSLTSNYYIPCTLRYASSSSVSGRKLYVWVANNVWNSNSTSTSQSAASSTGLYTSGASEPFKVDYYMVNQMAAKFLSTGTTDIYGCDTAILGKEYYDSGSTPAGGLITPQGEVHIYIIDLNASYTSSEKGDGGVLGYFYAADNFTSSVYTDSNQKIMFQLDAQMLANPTVTGTNSSTTVGSSTWTLTGSYWPNQLVSTLAHEFQHMIHFYQKQIVHNLSSSTDTWINEMCSMVTEDMVASQLGTLGPREVQFISNGSGSASSFSYAYGPGNPFYVWNSSSWVYQSSGTGYNGVGSRMAFFNYYYPYQSLESWTYQSDGSGYLGSYGIAYSFGAWLIRNFGGPQLVNAIVTNGYTDENAVVNAVNSLNGTSYSMAKLVEMWAAAELLKTYATAAPYRLIGPSNTFSPSAIGNNSSNAVASVSFTYGSLNPATYFACNNSYLYSNGVTKAGGPLLFTSTSSLSSIPARGFLYYTPSGTSGLTGTKTYSVYVPANVNLQVVTVPH